jgi:hypothetical protein
LAAVVAIGEFAVEVGVEGVVAIVPATVEE